MNRLRETILDWDVAAWFCAVSAGVFAEATGSVWWGALVLLPFAIAFGWIWNRGHKS